MIEQRKTTMMGIGIIICIILIPTILRLWGGLYWLSTQTNPTPVDRTERVENYMDRDVHVGRVRILNGS